MKTCTKCRVEKALTEFVKDKNRPNGRGSWCVSCHRPVRAASVAQWRAKNLKAYRASFFQKRREQFEQLKSAPCLDCGGRFPSFVMDFDHRDPALKEGSLALMAGTTVSWGKILREASKCDLVCVCCHRLRTHVRRGNGSAPRPGAALIEALKREKPCLDCGKVLEPWQMDFDHLVDKETCVAWMRGSSTQAILQEVAKCELVCANCHRVRTHKRHNLAEAS